MQNMRVMLERRLRALCFLEIYAISSKGAFRLRGLEGWPFPRLFEAGLPLLHLAD